MRDRCLQLISRQRFDLNSFESDEMANFVGEIFKFVDLNPESAKELLPSARTLKRHMLSDSANIQEFLIKYGYHLAKKSFLFLLIDHKSLVGKTGDDGSSALGILLTLKRQNERMHCYLLAFRNVIDKSDRKTEEIVWKVLEVNNFYFR